MIEGDFKADLAPRDRDDTSIGKAYPKTETIGNVEHLIAY